MKYLKLISMLLVLQSLVQAQPYQEKTFNHPDAYFASGTYCRVNSNPGFLLLSYEPSLVNFNFYIDRTDVGGDFTTASWVFSNEYEIWYGQGNCGTPSVQANNLTGMTIIETNLTGPTRDYAIAGVIDDGGSDGAVFFATLDQSGTAVDQMYYPFPDGYSNPSKPLLLEASTPGEYYICGSYKIDNSNIGEMYFLHVDASGAVLNAINYDVAAYFLDFIPAEMILSPYQSEIALVGKVECTEVPGGGGFVNKGFFMRIDESNLSNVTCIYYGQTPTYYGTSDDYFSSICVATSTTGSDGFVIGGHSDYDAGNSAYLWAVKIDPVGNLIWNNVFDVHFDQSSLSDGVSVIERFSTAYGFTYYMAVTSPDGMIVVKLDDNGDAFLMPSVPIDDWNEFIYDVGGIDARASKITFLDNSGNNDIGIHVYGDADMVYASDIYLVEAAFNGYTDAGCMPSPSDRNSVDLENTGPAYTATPDVHTFDALTECVNISINSATLATGTTTWCYAASIPTLGSLNKSTGLTNYNALNELNVYPNPSHGKLNINFGGNFAQDLSWELVDTFGQIVLKSDDCISCTQIEYGLELDLSPYLFLNGIYYLRVSNKEHLRSFKISFQKE